MAMLTLLLLSATASMAQARALLQQELSAPPHPLLQEAEPAALDGTGEGPWQQEGLEEGPASELLYTDECNYDDSECLPACLAYASLLYQDMSQVNTTI